jgi:hypothetical protein
MEVHLVLVLAIIAILPLQAISLSPTLRAASMESSMVIWATTESCRSAQTVLDGVSEILAAAFAVKFDGNNGAHGCDNNGRLVVVDEVEGSSHRVMAGSEGRGCW